MTEKRQHDIFHGPLALEIMEFIDFKRQSGSEYVCSEYALKAFDRFCSAEEHQALDPWQLAEAWCRPGDGKPKYDDGCSVRQLGQYLTEIGHPKAYTVLSTTGSAPRRIGVNTGPFAMEVNEFVEQKRISGRKYVAAEFCLKTFDIFCAMKENEALTSQQLADAWRDKTRGRNSYYLSIVREFGLYLTMQCNSKSFTIPYANGEMPNPPFTGYTSLFADGIDSFLETKRSAGLKYRHEVFRLKAFDKFCNEHHDLSPQQLADTFLSFQDGCGYEKRKRSNSVIRALGSHLVGNGHPTAFTIMDENCVVGPYAEEIEVFVAFKRSCGYKYCGERNHLRGFDEFCVAEENMCLAPQQIADKWVLKREGENANTRAGRVGPVRVFGKYLMGIGHPKAFVIADDAAPGGTPKPPYLFVGDEVERFFAACAELQPDEKDPSIHLVLPAAFLFMHCMGVRTYELKILMENVNFDTGEVLIAEAKTGDRVVYMSGELSELLVNYSSEVERIYPFRAYLFPASVSRARNDFAKHFSRIWAASVALAGHSMPRLYDFRHHFLYRNVEFCMRNGGDVNVIRPYIMKHMGHKLPESFQYYFHLSPPIRKEVSRIKNSLDWMIPDAPEVPYE